MTENKLITRPDYERDARHYAFDFADTGFNYEVGDVLSVAG